MGRRCRCRRPHACRAMPSQAMPRRALPRLACRGNLLSEQYGGPMRDHNPEPNETVVQTAGKYGTLLFVVRVDDTWYEALEGGIDFLDARDLITQDDTMFYLAEHGLRQYAVDLGADPDLWDDEPEPSSRRRRTRHQICDECGATIPRTPGSSLVSPAHAPSCSLHPDNVTGGDEPIESPKEDRMNRDASKDERIEALIERTANLEDAIAGIVSAWDGGDLAGAVNNARELLEQDDEDEEDEPSTDFDEIAAEQGWDTYSQLRICRSFIHQLDLNATLGEFARTVADEENEGTTF